MIIIPSGSNLVNSFVFFYLLNCRRFLARTLSKSYIVLLRWIHRTILCPRWTTTIYIYIFETKIICTKTKMEKAHVNFFPSSKCETALAGGVRTFRCGCWVLRWLLVELEAAVCIEEGLEGKRPRKLWERLLAYSWDERERVGGFYHPQRPVYYYYYY